jgi:acyl-CoA thioesterase II
MAVRLDDLLSCLRLTAADDDVLEGQNLGIGYHRVFGGQILGQVIAAAAASSPEKSVKSLSLLFPREGDTGRPMQYRVAKHQDGRTFGTTEVVASQDGKVIAVGLVSLHVDEDGLHRSDTPPDVGAPAAATPHELPMVPWEVRVVDGVDLADKTVGPPRLELWMRAPALGDERAVHQALLAHATDLTLIGTALRPFAGLSQADSTVTLHTAVTSHSVWFHQPFRLDDWLLLVQHSPVVAHGRAFGRGDVFSSSGEVVASFAQEAMIRAIPPAAP